MNGTRNVAAQAAGASVQGPEVFMYTRDYGDRTLGTFFVRVKGVQVFRCASLELPWNGNERGTSCVPAGTYTMVREFSPAFRAELWELKGVPGRDEVKIHAANFPGQLRGCIAPATVLADIDQDGKMDAASSRKALEGFHKAMGAARISRITIVALDERRRLDRGMNGHP